MQELCKSKLSWDQLLEGEALIKWCSIVDGLAMSQPTTIPRCFLSGVEDEMKLYRLYGFCDASTVAYAAVNYLVEERVIVNIPDSLCQRPMYLPLRSRQYQDWSCYQQFFWPD